MNRIKKLLCTLLAFAMIFSGIYLADINIVKAEADANSWKANAITAPVNGSLIGAGYIDIKWDNTLENVSKYDVYVDGALKKTVAPTSSEIMSYEFYTTAVTAHNTYVIATLKDGTSVKSSVTTFYVTKKGICVNTRDMGAKVDPADMNIGWYYNWGYKSFKEQKYSNKKFDNTEFVPMVWGDGMESIQDIMASANAQGYKYMLSYNEPDLGSEANTSPSTMILRWNDFMKYKGNMRLGSPAPSTANVPVESTKWWQPYWNGLSVQAKEETTFIAMHRYYEYYEKNTAQDFLMLVDETYAKYKKPIWITEFALWRFDKNDPEGCAKAQEFMKIVCKGLNERSYVERYSWFCPNYRDTAASSSAIFDYETGEITPIGKIYADIGNPAGYKGKTYGVSTTTSVDTSTAGCIKAMKATDVVTKARKKSFKYDINPIKRAAGYQIQYGTKKNMKGAKLKTVKKAKGTVKIKLTKKQKRQIKKKKKMKTIKYYVRVRAYKMLDGKKYYCKWSSKVKVKVKVR